MDAFNKVWVEVMELQTLTGELNRRAFNLKTEMRNLRKEITEMLGDDEPSEPREDTDGKTTREHTGDHQRLWENRP